MYVGASDVLYQYYKCIFVNCVLLSCQHHKLDHYCRVTVQLNLPHSAKRMLYFFHTPCFTKFS
jgi:hypothetical protein